MSSIPIFDHRRVCFSITDGLVAGMRGLSPRDVAGRMRLPTEPSGSVTITLSGIKPGSEAYIFDSSGNVLAGVESAADPQPFTLQRYATGNPLNNVRIFIASLGYENIDIAYTLPETNSSIPIQQRIDRNYRNP